MNLETDISFYEMKNGIRVVHVYDDSPVAYCGFAINVGTRDELNHESGMAHFIEHTLFKGTQKRKSWHIINRLESLGGELNAYTAKEETFIHATMLCDDYECAMELCSDILFHSTFPQKEIEKEVDVIIEEIQSCKDTPSEQIYDDFEGLLFQGTAMGRSVLGEAKKLKKYKTQDAVDFVQRTYCTDKILFFSLGKVPFKKVVRLAEKYFGDVPEKRSTVQSKLLLDYRPFQLVKKKRTTQAHVMLGGLGYDLSSDNRLPLALLNNILGGPSMNSKLNLVVREKHGMAYTIESSYNSYSDCGVFAIYYGTEEKNREKCGELVRTELKRVCVQPFSKLQLDRYKKQLMGQLAISQENRESFILSLAKSFLRYNAFESLSDINDQLEKITPEILLDVATETFMENKISELVFTN